MCVWWGWGEGGGGGGGAEGVDICLQKRATRCLHFTLSPIVYFLLLSLDSPRKQKLRYLGYAKRSSFFSLFKYKTIQH